MADQRRTKYLAMAQNVKPIGKDDRKVVLELTLRLLPSTKRCNHMR